MKMILMEIGSYLAILGIWYFFRKVLKHDITGGIVVGTMMGVFSEFASEPLCNYFFKLTFYKDIPVIIPIAWGMMYSVTVYLSEKFYSWVLKKNKIISGDKRILIFDILAGLLVGFPLETIGTRAGIWEYNYNVVHWTMPKIPVINMPMEALIAYALLMMIGPTVVRYWEGSFEGRL